jgi:hypothetical protein
MLKSDARGLYTVTAGATAGSCDAQFNSGGQRHDDGHGGNGGNGNLHIVNRI